MVASVPETVRRAMSQNVSWHTSSSAVTSSSEVRLKLTPWRMRCATWSSTRGSACPSSVVP